MGKKNKGQNNQNSQNNKQSNGSNKLPAPEQTNSVERQNKQNTNCK